MKKKRAAYEDPRPITIMREDGSEWTLSEIEVKWMYRQERRSEAVYNESIARWRNKKKKKK